MYKFSNKSLIQLNTCHKALQNIANEAIKIVDFTVAEGYRGEDRQNSLYPKYSKKKYPQSKHNTMPSEAFDIYPYPILFPYEDVLIQEEYERRMMFLGGVIKGVATTLGYEIRWGRDWQDDNIFSNDNFLDWGHFEIIL